MIAATALLAAYPLPPRRSAEADVLAASAQPSAAIPTVTDLTIGGEAGQILVGLSLRPGRPGANEALIFLSPLQPLTPSTRLPVELAVQGRTLKLTDCGIACRRADLELAGGEKALVRINHPDGGLAVFDISRLPAAAGDAMLAAVTQRMHGLASYSVQENAAAIDHTPQL